MEDNERILEERKLDEWDAGVEPDAERAAKKAAREARLIKCRANQYWSAALDAVNSWSAYNGKKKLYINAVHSETRHKVKNVVDDTFGGDLSRLAGRRDKLKTDFDRKLAIFANICQDCGLEPKYTENWCFNHIPDGNIAKKLRGKIQRRLNGEKPIEPLEKLL